MGSFQNIQNKRAFQVPFAYTDDTVTIDIPKGAYYEIKGHLTVADDTSTTSVIDVTGDSKNFVVAQNLKTTGDVTIAVANGVASANFRMTFTATRVGTAATAGQGYFEVSYTEASQSHGVFTDDTL